ncbi:monovalent cation/H+ antiporter complex subunit F [Fontisphaera persica]|uniref:monovalent cation/H+ antiporter complex subunit F n=1 Tax=Fontisphaera persica TaxID=2974023 RepID=UPI0024C04CCF|nr:monovalent cation/H+ antiporter complex subunit F [Fontisphaera persica]WCJ57846.1 monovalent cation/H+ antiporter complex subunit F [Fontisphaera persica]
MIAIVIPIAFAMLFLAILLGLYRLARGPTVLDRVLAFDLITTCAVGMIILLSIQWQTPLFLELILVFALLGFLTTVAFVGHLRQTRQPPGPPSTPSSPASPGAP